MPAQAQKIKTASSFEQFLVTHGFITKTTLQHLQSVKQNAGDKGKPKDTIEILIDEHLMDEEDMTKARAAFLNIPYIDLHKVEVAPEILNLIPEESRTFYKVAPFELQAQTLKLAIIDPTNFQALEALEFLGQKQNVQIQLFLASKSSIDTLLAKKRDINTVVGEALEDIQHRQVVTQQATPAQKESAKTQVIEDAPIIKIVDVIVTNAIEANASDIHIEPSEKDIRVRYRIDGILHTSLRLPKNVLSAIVSRIKILSNMKIDEMRLPQDGRFHMDVKGRSVDFRISTLPLMYGEKVVMRILDKSGSVPTLEQLGIRGRALTWVQENIKKTHGIFLITGPTGSGKSTTLYAILSILNTSSVNIVTLEDPVEYFIEGVNQSQINPDIGLTFSSGLRSILRQDPNIVMVGEVRDEETAELAVHAALTGHLVFSTLHTNNSVGAIPRLMNMGIEAFLLEASVNVVAAQRLVRKVCLQCKKVVPLGKEVKNQIMKDLIGVPEEYFEGLDKNKLSLYKGAGCDKCGNTGYKGRVGLFEVLPMIPEVQELLFTKAATSKIYEATLKLGMINLLQDGLIKVLRGETTLEEVARVTKE